MTDKNSSNRKDDIFSKIASLNVDMKGRNLINYEPPVLERNELPLDLDFQKNGKKPFSPVPKMTTAEQLSEELKRQREYYKPFMANLAPPLESKRISKEINTFDWRGSEQGNKNDLQDAMNGSGSWEQLTIPHYGAPLGQAVTYYRTEFSLTHEMLSDVKGKEKFPWLCFKGVDYKAKVFINNQYAGGHEGFFAPFDIDISSYSHAGDNTLLIMVENDFICGSSTADGFRNERFGGDKIYAATGPGYDDPQSGWHHCPPGMGIYQDVSLECRAKLFISNLYIRPLPAGNRAEAWIEINSHDRFPEDISLNLSLFGQNFEEEVFTNLIYKPETPREIGVGDSFNETRLRAQGIIDQPVQLFMEKGVNYLMVPFSLDSFRWWEPETPWLYQLQVSLHDNNNQVIDTSSQHFGMRSFTQDTESVPKGMYYLNKKAIRLRGANTMGHEQQCVMKKDWDQLIDDLLLAKICHMNFLRLTQRPVQSEVYDFCDKLGLMTQTDLPLFGVLRRNQYCEALRQTKEMERLVRSHPCNIMVSYINEPFPNANNAPHRHLSRPELMNFFSSADMIVKMQNPDRVIKHVDGDYDPPSETLPDNHCYNIWYNGNGVDIGKLNQGYWLPTKKDWYWGCGEFGAEGLDPVDLMRRRYPSSWLPESNEEDSDWSPNSIVGAQSGRFHYCFYETPKSLNRWVEKSRYYQGWAVRFVTEAFRRQNMMATQAIHLFIDAFPSGWMKTIMDCERKPKPAYFSYREALTPLMSNIRTDRFNWFSGEKVSVEAWICNDTFLTPAASLSYYVTLNDKMIGQGQKTAVIQPNLSLYQGHISFTAPPVSERTNVKISLSLQDENGKILHDTDKEITLFPVTSESEKKTVYLPGRTGYRAQRLVKDLNLTITQDKNQADSILVDDFQDYVDDKEALDAQVEVGARLIFLSLNEGSYPMGPDKKKPAVVKFSSMLPLHFVSRDTGHELVDSFMEDDFRYWYDENEKCLMPILENTFTGEDFLPILTSGNTNDQGEWEKVLAVGERLHGQGSYILCQISLAGRIRTNPIAALFAGKLFGN